MEQPRHPVTTDRRTFLRVAGAAGIVAALADVTTIAGGAHAEPARGGTGPAAGAAVSGSATTGTEPAPGSGAIPDGPSTWGWNAADLLAFDPTTSPWARNLRCTIPRASRIAPFTPTQAHPDLDPATQLSMLDVDYAGSVFQARNQPIGDQDYVYTERFWPYIDIWGTWHGQVVRSATAAEIEDGTALYAVIDIPNPGYVEAAHKSGARCIGGWFWPRTTDFDAFLVQRADGSFPVADKIIEIKKYFGFDGLFINQEATITADEAAKLFAMFDYIKKHDDDFYLQYYDAVLRDTGRLAYQNRLDEANVIDLGEVAHQSVDSIFLNYDWPRADPGLVTSSATAKKHGFDPLKVAFAGVEMQQGGFNPLEDFGQIAGPGKKATTSVALFVPDQYWTNAAEKGILATQAGRAQYRDLQTYMWSGPKGNPAESGRLEKNPSPGRTNTLYYQGFDGIANWITERSPHSSLPISTAFTLGVGTHFNRAGAVVGTRSWDDAGIADVPFTWQFWTEHGTLAVDLDETDAWEGGHSLAVKGAGTLHCYKTDIAAPRVLDAALRVKGRLDVAVGITYRDGPNEIEWHRTHAGPSTHGWRELRATIPASDGRHDRRHGHGHGHGARRIARISLKISGTGNLGALLLTDGTEHLRRPGHVRSFQAADAGATTGTPGLRNVSFTWHAERDAYSYDVYQETRHGERWLGRAHRDALFVDAVDLTAGRTFRITPISAARDEGPASTARVR